MIVHETMEGNANLVKTYSDIGMMISKIGTDELYSEAIDPKKFDRRYEETDIPILEPEEKAELEKQLEEKQRLEEEKTK